MARLGILAFLLFAAFSEAKDPVHILYVTDCSKYSDW